MRLTPRHARALLCSAVALASTSLVGCAGQGHVYPCDPDGGGVCHNNPFGDAGTTVSDYVSTAVTVFHDGAHNSGTDVVAFNGVLFAIFRNSSAYTVSASSSVYVVTSSNGGATWTKTATLTSTGLDLREPKLAVYQDKLRATVTAWDPSDPNQHKTQVLAASSSDGTAFSKLASAGLVAGSEAWRPRVVSDSLWLSAWKADELFANDAPGGLSLFASTDGQTFNGGVAVPVGPGAHQADLLQRADNSLWLAVPERAESGTIDQQTICHTAVQLPYNFTCWSVAQAPVDSPVLFEFDGVLLLLGGHTLSDGRGRTALWQVDDADQQLNLIADLPQSEGETGNPGIVGLDATHALITYQSTSVLDPRVQALGHEPTTVEAESANFAVDVLAVQLDLSQVPAGL